MKTCKATSVALLAITVALGTARAGAAEQQAELRTNVETSGGKVMNNMVWELFNGTLAGEKAEHEFALPVDRWVFIESKANLRDSANLEIRLDDLPDPVIAQSATDAG